MSAPATARIALAKRTPLGSSLACGSVLLAVLLLTAAFGGVQPQWYLPVDAGLFLVGLGMVGSALMGRMRLAVSPVLAAVGLVLLAPLAQLALHRTVEPAMTQAGYIQVLAAAAAFFLGLQWPAGTSLEPALVRGFAVAAVLMAIWGVLQLFLTPQKIYGIHAVPGPAPMGPFVNHDDYAAALALLLPFCLLLIREARRMAGMLSWTLAAALVIAAVLVSNSRGGILSVVAELGLFAWFWQRGSGRRKGATLLVVSTITVFALAVGLQPVLRHFMNSGVSAQTRWALARSSLAMLRQRPLWGYGLGAWQSVYPRFATFDDGLLYQYAHNEYAQWAAETGLLGLLGGLVLLGAYGRALWLNLRSRAFPAVQGAAFLAVFGFLLHAAVDFLWHIPALALLFGFLAAVAVAGQSGHLSRTDSLPVHG